MEDIPEKYLTDISFIHVFNACIGDPTSKDNMQRHNLLSISNKYGLVFVATGSSFKSIGVTTIDQQIGKKKKVKVAEKMLDGIELVSSTELQGEVIHLSTNSTEEYLAVCSKKNGFVFAEIYDVRLFSKDGEARPFQAHSRPAPFQEVKLTSTNDETLVDFSWNPSHDCAGTFVACSSDGCASVFVVSPTEVSLAGSHRPTSRGNFATCVCWSPKGKMVAVGNESGEVTLFLPQMVPKSLVPPCPKLKEQLGGISVVDIWWESASSYFIVYESPAGDSEQPTLVHVRNQNQQLAYTPYGDICYGSSEGKKKRYQFNFIKQWNMLLVSSATSSELCLLHKEKDGWMRCNLEERPELCSLAGDYDTHFPRGTCLAYSSGHVWEVKVDDQTRPVTSLPLLMMSTDGCLSVVQFVVADQSFPPLRPSLPIATEAVTTTKPPQSNPTVVQTVTKPEKSSLPFGGGGGGGVQNPTNVMSLTATQFNPAFFPAASINVEASVKFDGRIDRSKIPPSEPSVVVGTQGTVGNQVEKSAVSAATGGGQSHVAPGEKTFGRQQSRKRSEGETQVDPYKERVTEEVRHFSEELKETLGKFSSFRLDKNFSAELDDLRQSTRLLLGVKDELHQQLVDINREVEEQKTETLELFAMSERCRVTHERNKDPKFVTLLRQRPLDVDRKSKMAAIEASIIYVGMELSKVQAVLDSNWKDYMDAQRRERFLQPPSLHIIYETLCSNRLTISKIRNLLVNLKKKVESNPSLGRNKNLSLSEMFSNSCNMTSPAKGTERFKREKEAELREYFLNRKVVTVRSTAPENLNSSKIVSAVQMREIESRKNANAVAPDDRQRQEQPERQPPPPFVDPKQQSLPFSQLQMNSLEFNGSRPSVTPSFSVQRTALSNPLISSSPFVPHMPGSNLSISKDPKLVTGGAKELEPMSILPSINKSSFQSSDSPKPPLSSPCLASAMAGSKFSFGKDLQLATSNDSALSTAASSKPGAFASSSKLVPDTAKSSRPVENDENKFPSEMKSQIALSENTHPQNFSTIEMKLNNPTMLEKNQKPRLSLFGMDLKSLRSVSSAPAAFTFGYGKLYQGPKADSGNEVEHKASPTHEGQSIPNWTAEDKSSEGRSSGSGDDSEIIQSVANLKSAGKENNNVLSLVSSKEVSSKPASGLFGDRQAHAKESLPMARTSNDASFITPKSVTADAARPGGEVKESLHVQKYDGTPTSALSPCGGSGVGGQVFGQQKKLDFGGGEKLILSEKEKNSNAENVEKDSSEPQETPFGGSKLEPVCGDQVLGQQKKLIFGGGNKTDIFKRDEKFDEVKAESNSSEPQKKDDTPSTPSFGGFGSKATGVEQTFGQQKKQDVEEVIPSGKTDEAKEANDSSAPEKKETVATFGTSEAGFNNFGAGGLFGHQKKPNVSENKNLPAYGETSGKNSYTLPGIGSSPFATYSASDQTSATSITGTTSTLMQSKTGGGDAQKSPQFGLNVATLGFGATQSPFGAPVAFGSGSAPSIFGAPSNIQASTESSTAGPKSIFGSSAFGAAASSAPTVFGSFGGLPTAPGQSIFGGNGSKASPAPPAVFGASPVAPSGSSIFGGSPFAKSAQVANSPPFGGSSDADRTSEMKPFGSTSTPSVFGANKPLFGGQSSPGFGQAPAFGQTLASGESSGGSLFGSSSGLFCGLGGKPSEERAAINVFGSTNAFGGGQADQGVFGQSTAGGMFGSVRTDVNIQGSFTNNNAGIAASGFGGFQKPAAPAFGSTVFGSPGSGQPGGAFGGAPVFGSFGASPAAPSQGRVFGSGDTCGFSGFANVATPSFESLVPRSGGSDFGNIAQQGGGFSSFSGGGGSNTGFEPTFQSKSPQFTQFRS